MSTKCSGLEFLLFYNDENWWFAPDKDRGVSIDDSTYWENAEIKVNGVIIDDNFDFGTQLLPADIVTVRGGVVFGKVVGAKEPTFEGYLKRWLKAQSTTRIVVECPKDKLDTVFAAVKAAGGLVIS